MRQGCYIMLLSERAGGSCPFTPPPLAHGPFPGENMLLLFTKWSHLLGKHHETQLGFIIARFIQDFIKVKTSWPYSKNVPVLTLHLSRPHSCSLNPRREKKRTIQHHSQKVWLSLFFLQVKLSSTV